jgi:hypothetical protein
MEPAELSYVGHEAFARDRFDHRRGNPRAEGRSIIKLWVSAVIAKTSGFRKPDELTGFARTDIR